MYSSNEFHSPMTIICLWNGLSVLTIFVYTSFIIKYYFLGKKVALPYLIRLGCFLSAVYFALMVLPTWLSLLESRLLMPQGYVGLIVVEA